MQRSRAIKSDITGIASAHANGRADRREHPGLPERTQTGAAGNGREQTFNRLTTCGHYGAVGPFFNPRKDRRLHRCDERNAERSRDGRKPVVQKPDKKKKGGRRSER